MEYFRRATNSITIKTNSSRRLNCNLDLNLALALALARTVALHKILHIVIFVIVIAVVVVIINIIIHNPTIIINGILRIYAIHHVYTHTNRRIQKLTLAYWHVCIHIRHCERSYVERRLSHSRFSGYQIKVEIVVLMQ